VDIVESCEGNGEGKIPTDLVELIEAASSKKLKQDSYLHPFKLEHVCLPT
jgi:hypothetical protein